MLIRRLLQQQHSHVLLPLALRYSSSMVHGTRVKKKTNIGMISKSASQSETSTTPEWGKLSWQGEGQTERLMRRSETRRQVLKVSWDGLQGGFRTAILVDVLKQ